MKKTKVDKLRDLYRDDLRRSPAYEGDPNKLNDTDLYLAWMRYT